MLTYGRELIDGDSALGVKKSVAMQHDKACHGCSAWRCHVPSAALAIPLSHLRPHLVQKTLNHLPTGKEAFYSFQTSSIRTYSQIDDHRPSMIEVSDHAGSTSFSTTLYVGYHLAGTHGRGHNQ